MYWTSRNKVGCIHFFPNINSQVTNVSLVSWFFLIFFPKWRKLTTAVLCGPVVNAFFYAAVAFLAARNPHAPPVDFSSLAGEEFMAETAWGEIVWTSTFPKTMKKTHLFPCLRPQSHGFFRFGMANFAAKIQTVAQNDP